MDIREIDRILSPNEDDKQYNNFNSDKGLLDIAKKGGIIAGTTYGTYKLGKTGAVRFLDTLGFGNVPGSYGSPNKFSQALDNIYASTGSIRKMPGEIIKASLPSGIPAELKATESSIKLLEDKINSLRGSGKKVPKKLFIDLNKHKELLPNRVLASAIKETWAKNPINFPYEGEFIKNTKPQNYDRHVAKALKDKGFSLKAKYDVFDPPEWKVKELNKASVSDPRAVLINRELKKGNISRAAYYAKNGSIKLGGKIVDTNKSVEMYKKGKGYVLKYTPHKWLNKKLIPHKDFVFGGYNNRSYFMPYKGGYHRAISTGFDITSYASVGEKGTSLAHRARILAAGEYPRKLGLHKGAVVSEWRYHHPLGRGKTVGAKSSYKAKRYTGKLIAAAEEPYIGDKPTSRIPKKKLKNIKSLTKSKKLTQAARVLLSIALRRKI